MNDEPDFGRLLRRTLIAVLVGAVLVAVCYQFVDRTVARFVYDNRLRQYVVLDWLTLPPPVVQAWAPVALVVVMVRRAWGPLRHWERALVAASVGIIVADQFRESMAYLAGRYWPETWIDNNPSYIQNGEYGFHPFHSGRAYGSFPSGHTARTVAVAAVVWVAFPWWRWAAVLCSLAVAVGLIGMNYHFVGDVIGGAFVGGIVGTYTAVCCGLNVERRRVPRVPAAPLESGHK